MKETEKNNERLEVGEYVRLERSQGIRKIIEIDDEREGVYILDREILNEYGDDVGEITIEDVKKHSKNIYSLLEGGDRAYIEYDYHYEGQKEKSGKREWFDVHKIESRYGEFVYFVNRNIIFTYHVYIEKYDEGSLLSPEILEIVPWEQFNRVRYEVK